MVMTAVQDEGKRKKAFVRLKVGFLMEQAGMNAQELADRADVAYNTALAYQRGSIDRLSRDILSKIAAVLGVDVQGLFWTENEYREYQTTVGEYPED